eukprot:1156085-Pelagomonas_calceolata.AAC.9
MEYVAPKMPSCASCHIKLCQASTVQQDQEQQQHHVKLHGMKKSIVTMGNCIACFKSSKCAVTVIQHDKVKPSVPVLEAQAIDSMSHVSPMTGKQRIAV